ncbi:response regulator transcription factor [Actinoplanes sichuanensis]|uniref:Response regulator transcription factor n=1 Tax=Actinoplanes sichuanensis TaxID=512349 RepID=A0ABW4AAV8_9ACTN|nr:response regulator transcription factor [Actinoplanes sichuanensis]BEL05355.1 response regulator transcription factor [Actinoplanes sichuanensis]
MIRILLAEPVNLLRGALAATLSLEEDLTVVAELDRLDKAPGMARAVRADVAVVDIGLSPVAGLGTDEVRCGTLLLAGSEAPATLHRALEDPHVRGVISTQAAPHELVQAIRQLVRGERVVDPRLAVAMVAARPSPLSAREADVLRVAGSGVPSTEVAAMLHLTAGTVRNYMSVILRKTGARNRLEAVRVAESAGWLQ